MFKLEIETFSNAAFEPDKSIELVRILKSLITKIEKGEEEGKLKDINGNNVGEFYIDYDEQEF